MSVSALSASTQNYLKAIWGLTEWSSAQVTPTLIAERTGLKLSSVSDAVRKLASQGLVDHAPYGAVELTETGRSYALVMVRRHRLIEAFLVSVLGYSWDQVHDEAEHLEHAVSDFMIDRIDEFLEFPTRDPHGGSHPVSRRHRTYPRCNATDYGRSGAPCSGRTHLGLGPRAPTVLSGARICGRSDTRYRRRGGLFGFA